MIADIGMTGVQPYDQQAPSPIWSVDSDDSYESSRLAIPGWLASFADKVDGRPIAVVPHRSMLLVAGDAQVETIERLLDTAHAEFSASPRFISPVLYCVGDGGRIEPYRVGRDHPLYIKFVRNERLLALAEYGVQKDHLDRLHEANGTEVFVANYTLIERPNGLHVSYCVWGEDVASLLPETDVVVFGVGDEHLVVRWADAKNAVGDLWVPEPELEPARVRTAGWPDAALLDKIRGLAIDMDEL